MTAQRPDMTVVIPVFNEEEAIADTLDDLIPVARENGWKLIVVDDGSRDATGEILSAREDGVTVVTHKVNRGYGASLKSGIRHAEGDLVAFYDSDGQHTPDQLEKLWDCWGRQDMVVGQRSRGSHLSLARAPGKWLLARIANFLAGRKIPDLNSGLRIVRRDLMIRYTSLFPDGFSFSTTSTIAFISDRRLVEYVPVQTRKRTGKSSVRQIRDGFGTILQIIRLVTLFNPLKVFLPASLILILVGLIYEVLWGYLFSTHLKLLPGALLTFLTGVIVFFFGLIIDQISEIRRNSMKE